MERRFVSRSGLAAALLVALVLGATVSWAGSGLSLSASVTSTHATVITRICGATHRVAVVHAGRAFRVAGGLTTTSRVTLHPLRAILVSCPGFRLVETRSVPIQSSGTYRAAFTPHHRGDYRLRLQFNADATHEAHAVLFVRAR